MEDTRRAAGVGELLGEYDGFLIDAFGVLVDSGGPLPGAVELVGRLRADGVPFVVVTNDASRLPSTWAARLAGFGLEVGEERIVTSGSLLSPYFARQRLAGARCMVLGPADSLSYVQEAGGEVVEPAPDRDYDAIVVCDDAGYPFLDTLDTALSALYRQLDRGDRPHLVCPNPDLVYPKGEGLFGFTSGAVALVLEAALARRYPAREPRFVRLGKPHRPMFEEARRRAGGGKLVMIGDQLETDIAGARAAGLHAALLTTGITRWDEAAELPEEARPTWLLDSLAL